MPISPRTHAINNKPKCPDHPSAVVLSARRPGQDRLQWICMDCGKKLGDAGPVDYSRDKFTVG